MPKIPLGKNGKVERKVHFFFMRVNVLMAEMKKSVCFFSQAFEYRREIKLLYA